MMNNNKNINESDSRNNHSKYILITKYMAFIEDVLCSRIKLDLRRYTWYTQVQFHYHSLCTNSRPSHSCRIEPHTQTEFCLTEVVIKSKSSPFFYSCSTRNDGGSHSDFGRRGMSWSILRSLFKDVVATYPKTVQSSNLELRPHRFTSDGIKQQCLLNNYSSTFRLQ